ncbi:AI-2E family transporter [Pseudoroseomonas cervicalis]|uniref:AI-2E family transporter n=1 Tax=Teichococcus cervicalis TaxID=204525 RepID=UPI002785A643|nr:AI-2E family transporter [Pseudoroseomonas cervicalis]MDQ1077683.1 putative PurR-regulated permease PerM [Pseudoroseomonas cervicalis]
MAEPPLRANGPATRAKVAPAEAPDLRSLTTLAGGVVVVAGLYLGREVLIPVTLAILLSLVLSPLVRVLRRLRVGRITAVLLAVLVALGIILAAAALIGAQLAELAQNAPLYQHTVQQKLDTLRQMTIGRIGSLVERLGEDFGRAPPPVPSITPPRDAAVPPLPVEIHSPDMTPMQMVRAFLAPLAGPLTQAGIVLVVTIFVLLQREDLRDRLIRLFGSTDLHRTTVAMDDAAIRLSRFFLAQLCINLGFGAVIGLGLLLIGVPSPLLWGLVAALLRFVPFIGGILGAVLPIGLAASVDPGWSMALWTAALFLAVEPIAAHVVEPLTYGHSTGMSPVSVIIAAIFWSWIWGPIGLIIATPVTLCLVVLGRHVERLEFLDVLLGDRPALTPVENFYQRALAGDPDEAQEQAEALLKERSLSSYYDEVALKGLALAAADVRRGLVTPTQLDRIRDSVTELAESLDEHDDSEPTPPPPANGAGRMLRLSGAEQRLPRPAPMALPSAESIPPAWQAEGAVLCIAGRGPLDEVSATMLAQILRKHGLGAQVVPYAEVSRRAVGHFEAPGARMACICAVQMRGAPTHLRYLLRRLRQRLPRLPLMVGLWAAPDNALDDALHQSLGVPLVVGTLREAVIACARTAARAPE